MGQLLLAGSGFAVSTAACTDASVGATNDLPDPSVNADAESELRCGCNAAWSKPYRLPSANDVNPTSKRNPVFWRDPATSFSPSFPPFGPSWHMTCELVKANGMESEMAASRDTGEATSGK